MAAPPPPGRGRRLRVALAILAAAAAVCLVVALLPGGRAGTPNLAARAYAATTGGGIVHWRIEQHNYSNANDIEHLRIEGWARRGVTHIVRYVARRGTVRLREDSRTADGLTKTYVAASDDYITVPTPRSSPSANPLAGGDPFAIFRTAYRTGKLKRIDERHFAVELFGHDAHPPSAIYELDPRTALPTRFTLSDTVVNGGRRYDNRLVMRFEVYERLPFTQANRAKLRLLPHPGAGPKDEPAADHFAVLRGDRRPDPDALAKIEQFARGTNQFALNADAARTLAPGHYLVPGHGYVCLVTVNEMGFGAGCAAIAQAVKHGYASGNPKTGKTVVVPDGVKALRTREAGGKSRVAAVRDNFATIPFAAYDWRFVR